MGSILDRLLLDRRGLLVGAASAGGSLMLPKGALAQATPHRGGTLRVALPYNPVSVDPMTGVSLPDFDILYAVFDALIDFDPATLELRPGLAKAWRFTDGRTLVLDLVDNAKFHDGTNCDAAAVKFNLDRYKSDTRSNVKADLAGVDAIEVTGPHQVTLKLNRPNAGLPNMLTNRIGLMVSPKSIQDAEGGNVNRKPVGTGPFKFVSWQDNDRFVLARNENYWQPGLPHLDGVTMRIITELNTAVRAVSAGEADIAVHLQAPQKAIADRSSGVVANVAPSLVFYGIYINHGRPPFNDVRLRQALNYAVNRDEINKIAMAGLGQPSSAILPRQHWACDPATQNFYSHDPEKAKKLVADAGHPEGIEIDTYGWSDQLSMQRQEVIISQLAKANIRVKLTTLAPAQATQTFAVQKKGDMYISGVSPFPDPSQFYEALFSKTALRNPGGTETPELRDLLNKTMEAKDQAARKAAFADLQRHVIEQALISVHFIAPAVSVASPKVKGYQDGLLSVPKFTSVWLET